MIITSFQILAANMYSY